MKQKFRGIIICIVLMFVIFPVPAHADTGPKPSVQVDFTDMENELYYVTLLSQSDSTGPATAYDGNNQYACYQEGDEGYEIRKKFVDYQDSDGYYFLQWFEQCSGNDTYLWSYYPPSPFKVLVYFPERDTFAVSEVCERYAFDSYFIARLDASESGTLVVSKTYHFKWEMISLAARIVITILIELVIALFFGFRTKKQLCFLAVVNILTQTALNILLNILNYNRGPYAFTFYYVVFELLIFAVEAVLYRKFLSGEKEKPARPVLYALTANVLSFASGLWLAHIIPGIF